MTQVTNPNAVPVMMDHGEALTELGLTTIEWWDPSLGFPGVHKMGRFDHTKQDVAGRYVGLTSLSGINFDANDNAGAHAGGLNSQILGGVVETVLSKRLSSDTRKVTVRLDMTHALTDFDLVRGATALVVGDAIAQGLLAPDPGPTMPVPAPTPIPQLPPVDQAPGMLAPLSPARVRVEELRVILLRITRKAWNDSPPGGSWLESVAGTTDNLLRSDAIWSLAKPVAVELLRFYRLMRAAKSDTRVIPTEDR
jgi:hypothetical protein